jgi:hypothetical protein
MIKGFLLAGQYCSGDHGFGNLDLPFVVGKRQGSLGCFFPCGFSIVFIDGFTLDVIFSRGCPLGVIVYRIQANPGITATDCSSAVYNRKIDRSSQGELDECALA